MNIHNFSQILQFLNTVKPTSIEMTKKMLILKKRFILLIHHLEEQISEIFEKVIQLDSEKDKLSEFQKSLENKKDYIEQISYEDIVTPSLNWNLTCKVCKKTCHKNCQAVNMFLSGC